MGEWEHWRQLPTGWFLQTQSRRQSLDVIRIKCSSCRCAVYQAAQLLNACLRQYRTTTRARSDTLVFAGPQGAYKPHQLKWWIWNKLPVSELNDSSLPRSSLLKISKHGPLRGQSLEFKSRDNFFSRQFKFKFVNAASPDSCRLNVKLWMVPDSIW